MDLLSSLTVSAYSEFKWCNKELKHISLEHGQWVMPASTFDTCLT